MIKHENHGNHADHLKIYLKPYRLVLYPTFHEADISKFTAAMNEYMTKFDIKIVLTR